MLIDDLETTNMTKDCFDVEKRSQVMKSVGKWDTAPELRLRLHLWKNGLRYRKHPRVADTRPDLAFVGSRIAVFVDGCFWHGCPRHYVAPVGNAAFWSEKLRRNQLRDNLVTAKLKNEGWTVVRVWECEVHRQLDIVTRRICQLVEQGGAKMTGEVSGV